MENIKAGSTMTMGSNNMMNVHGGHMHGHHCMVAASSVFEWCYNLHIYNTISKSFE